MKTHSKPPARRAAALLEKALAEKEKGMKQIVRLEAEANWLASEAEWRTRQILIPDNKIGIDEFATIDYQGVKTKVEADKTFRTRAYKMVKGKIEETVGFSLSRS